MGALVNKMKFLPAAETDSRDSFLEVKLLDIANNLTPGEWEEVAIRLGCKRAEIERCKADNTNTLMAMFSLLDQWVKRQPKNANTIEDLAEALKKSGSVSLSEQLLKAHSTPFEVTQCREELKSSYRKWLFTVPEYPGDINGLPIDTVFEPVQISPYIPTGVSTRLNGSQKENSQELGTHNEVFEAVNAQPPRRGMLTSHKGCGMSTLVAKMTHEWVTHDQTSPLKNFELLFVLDLSKVGRMTLEEAILDQLLPHDTKVTRERLREFIEQSPLDVAFFLCGHDQCIQRKLSDDIRKLINYDVLRDALVMVTTHNWSIADFCGIESYQCYEVLGFRTSSVLRYINRRFSLPKRLQENGLVRFLELNDLLPGIASDPAIISLLCQFWKSIDGNWESTSISQLYSSLFNFIHKCTKSSSRVRQVGFRRFLPIKRKTKPREKTKDVPSLSQITTDLGKIAFESSWCQENPREDFTIAELREALHPDVISEAIHMGLLRYGFLVKNPRADFLPNVWDFGPDAGMRREGRRIHSNPLPKHTDEGKEEEIASVTLVQAKPGNNTQLVRGDKIDEASHTTSLQTVVEDANMHVLEKKLDEQTYSEKQDISPGDSSTKNLKHKQTPSTASIISTVSGVSVVSGASGSFEDFFSHTFNNIEAATLQEIKRVGSETHISVHFDNTLRFDPLLPTLFSSAEEQGEDLTLLGNTPTIVKRYSTFTFFHKSVRDRCAGEYLAQQNPAWVNAVLQQLETLDDVLNHAWILRFASGANADVAKLIIERLVQVYLQDEEIRITHPRFYDDVVTAHKWGTIQRYIELCLACNYESDCRGQFTSVLSQLFLSGRAYFLGISPAAVVHFGYYLSNEDADAAITSLKITPFPRKRKGEEKEGFCCIKDGPVSRLYKTYKKNLADSLNGEFLRYLSADDKLLYGCSMFASEGNEILWTFFSNWPCGGEGNLTYLFNSLQGKTLKSIDLSGIPLTDRFRYLIQVIEQLESLEDLQLNRANLKESHISQLEVLRKLKNLHMLGISQNKAGDGLPSLVKGLAGLPIEKLDISDMDAPAQSMKAMIGLIQEFTPRLTELKIHGNRMDYDSVTELWKVIQRLQEMKQLSISMHVEDEIIQNKVLTSIGYLQHLQELSVHQAAFPDQLLQDISRCLDSLASIHTIFLDAKSKASISTRSAEKFISWMKSREHLTRMTLLGFILHQDDFHSLLRVCQKKDFVYLGYSFTGTHYSVEMYNQHDTPFLELLYGEKESSESFMVSFEKTVDELLVKGCLRVDQS